MPDLGERGNVMGPQPIGKRSEPPPAMLAAAQHVLDLLAAGDRAGLEALSTPTGAREIAEVARAIRRGSCTHHEVIATARINKHHYVKAKLICAEPITVQFRLGESGGKWLIWEAANLTGRAAWTR
jgi:hypothetical protein